MINSEPTSIPFRSVSEQRYHTAVLLQEGKWDSDSQQFRTRESQLQEISRHFTHQHQLLRVSPQLAYSREGNNLDAVYPQAPKVLLKNYHVEAKKLHEADPSPSNIKDIDDVLSRRKSEAARKAQLQREGVEQEEDEDEDDENTLSSEFGGGDDSHGGGEHPTTSSSSEQHQWNRHNRQQAQDARSQLESEFLRSASKFGVDSKTGVAAQILSPSKYSRPSPFMSGSHSKRPKRDRGYVANPTTSSAFSGEEEEQQQAEGEGDQQFFMTDMTRPDDPSVEDLLDNEDYSSSRKKKQGGLFSSSRNRNQQQQEEITSPTLPPIGSTPRGRKVQKQHGMLSGGGNIIDTANLAIPSPAYRKGASPSSSQQKRQQSPYQSRTEPVYSSLLHELRSTRVEVEEEAKRCSTLQAIAGLGGTPEFRRTVTRIFANPEDAERISDEEMRRLQKLFDKLSKQQQQMDSESSSMIATSVNRSQYGGGQNVTTGSIGNDAVANFERDLANVTHH